MTHGQVIEMVMPTGGVCRCGRNISSMDKVSFWRSSYGPAHDQILACSGCERPKELIPERMWLMKQREALKNLRFPYIYGSSVLPGGVAVPVSEPPELHGAWVQNDSELDANWRNINVVLMKLLEKLPKCEDCQRYATVSLKNGPAYCDVHGQEYTSASDLPWVRELRELGVTKDM